MSKELKIIITPNSVLRQEAKEVAPDSIKTPKIQNLISGMKETLKKTSNGIGLAAPQIGESLRIFIVSEEAKDIDRAEKMQKNSSSAKTPAQDKSSAGKPEGKEKLEWKYYAFINPAAKKTSKKKLEGPEGCLSVPEKFGLVKRSEKITIQYFDETGQKFTRGFTKFFARVVQHELDHLNGALFIDKTKKMIESSPRDKTLTEKI